MKLARILPAALLLGGGCASINSFHQEPFDTNAPGSEIVYDGDHTVWFRFDNDTSWVMAAREKFVSQCPSGKITGVSSRLSTENSFLHWYYHIRLAGTCIAQK